jgi:2-hydroxy-3-keto-5-methylthiopentenyl-1-phosphate phosphatase
MDHLDAKLAENLQQPVNNFQQDESTPAQIATSRSHHEDIVKIENLYLKHLLELGETSNLQSTNAVLPVSRLIPDMYPKASTAEEITEKEKLISSFLGRFDTRAQIDILIETDRLVREIRDFRQSIARKYNATIAHGILQKYKEADQKSLALNLDKDGKVKERVEKFNGIQIISDFDGTMSTDPKEYLDRLIPGNALVDPYLEQYGREILPLMHVLAWQRALREDPEYFLEGGKRTPLRRGVNEFLQYAREKNIPVTIVSTGFMPFLKGAMTQLPDSEQVKLIGVSAESIVSSDKGTVIADLAQGSLDRATIFIGDGSTDRPALDARDMIACYFALEGSGFAKQLEAFNKQAREKGESKVIYYTYNDFTDIHKRVEGFSSALQKI